MMGGMPVSALVIFYWLHMLATIFAVGGLATLSLLVLPIARSVLDPVTQATFLEKIQRRLEVLGWFSLSVLVVTGMFQLSANPNYAGFFSISSLWAQAILVKHLLVGAMVAVSMTQTWGLLPEIRRALLRAQKTGETSELVALRRRETWLVRLNMALSILVLLMTAMARSL
jgi:uncharacterized membrane protein